MANLDDDDELAERVLGEVAKGSAAVCRKVVSGDTLWHDLRIKLIMRVHGCSRSEAEERIRARDEPHELLNSEPDQTVHLKEKRGRYMREILRKR